MSPAALIAARTPRSPSEAPATTYTLSCRTTSLQQHYRSQSNRSSHQANLSFSSFKSRLEADIAAAGKYDEYIQMDRDLSKQIKDLQQAIQEESDTFSKETEEQNQEILKLKTTVNELDVETKLQVQYLERKLQGEQSCDNRIARIKETEKETRIK